MLIINNLKYKEKGILEKLILSWYFIVMTIK